MKVFMSWSGARSKAAAELLKWWTRSVIQAARPWISTEDIDRGALWFSEISNGLSDTAIGIVCLTHENKERPWILFEAGALAKGLSNSRVCTFLVDLEPSDIRDPLAQFNHTQPNEQDMRKLARTLNRALNEHALDDAVLTDAFDAYWGQFQHRWQALIETIPPATEVVKRPADDIMSEILENVRGMNQRIRTLEAGTEKTPTWGEATATGVGINPQRRALRITLQQRITERLWHAKEADSLMQEGLDMGFSKEVMREIFKRAQDQANFQRPFAMAGARGEGMIDSVLKNADIPGLASE